MKKSLFSIDTLGARTFDGFDTNDTWNGWDVPVFTFEQAKKIVAAWQAQGWPAYYNEGTDTFVFGVNADPATGEAQEQQEFQGYEMDGHKLYAIGSGSWIWERLDAPE